MSLKEPFLISSFVKTVPIGDIIYSIEYEVTFFKYYFKIRYERDEAFLGLNLPIKSGNLQDSLQQFVKDELLDGDNSYNCEKCNEKVHYFLLINNAHEEYMYMINDYGILVVFFLK